MGESQNIGIQLDKKSIDILKGVDALHRDSLINVGLALVEQTKYYKTLAGVEDPKDINSVADLGIVSKDKSPSGSNEIVNESTNVQTKQNKPKPSTSWDSF